MKQDNNHTGWTFYDWFVLAFLVVMLLGLLSALSSPPLPVEPGFLER